MTENYTNWQRRSIRMPSKSTIYVSDFSNNRLEPIQHNLITIHSLLDAGASQQHLFAIVYFTAETHSASFSVRPGRF